jgi:photosystem II stability/assembly factor-like uncharacterized protein
VTSHRAALVLLGLLVCGGARAHGGAVEATSLHARTASGERVLGTTFGIVQRTSATGPWEVICSEAIGYDEANRPVVHLADDGALFVGSIKGLFVSRDGGCSWAAIPEFATRGVTALTASPTSPGALFAATGKFGAQNGVFRSTDDGATFPEAVLQAPETFYSAVRFAPSAPARVWASAWYFAPARALLYRSDDAGQTFTELDTGVDAFSGFTLLAIHPTDPDHLLVQGFVEFEYALLRTTDGGLTFTEVARDGRAFRSAVFSADGTTVWAAAERVHRSDDGGATFVRLAAPTRAGCVARAEGETWVCGGEGQGAWALFREDPQGDLEGVLRFSELRERVCPAGTEVHTVCTPLWPALAEALGSGPGLHDGGTPDGGDTIDAGVADGGGVEPEPTGDGCHCAGGGWGLLWSAPLFLGLALRRRRRRRAPPGATAALLALTLWGCPSPPPPADPPPHPVVDPCDGFTCEAPGRSVCVVQAGVPRCACDEGLEDREGLCLSPLPPDPCASGPCTEPHRGVCTPVAGSAVCSCDEGHELEGEACQPLMPVTCETAHTEGDAFEPDECPALARDIGTSGQQGEPHTFFPAGDNDWYRVDAVLDRIYAFRAVGEPGLGIRVDVYGDGDPVVPVGPQRTGAGVLDFAVKAPANQPLYFRARAGAFGQLGAYAVNLGDLGPDDYPDVPEAAQPHALGPLHAGSIQFEGDVDTLGFPLGPQRSYRVQATWAEDLSPLRVTLHTGAPPELRRQVVDAAPDFTTHSPSGGLAALGLSATSGGRGGGWKVRVVDLGPDDHGDHPAEATALTPGLSATGSLERPGDRDAFLFSALAGHIYRFTCAPPSGLDCHLTLLDPSGAVVAEDKDGGNGDLFRKLAVGGEHVVLVHAPAGLTFSYAYGLAHHGPDDHGDGPNTATSMGMPVGTASGTLDIQFPGDRDFLHLEADDGHIYRLRCTRTTLGDCHLRVLDASGMVVAQDVDGGDVDLFHELSGGAHYLELFAKASQLGAATWQVDDLEHDDHGNTLALATPMSANAAWVQGEVQTPVDRDWFRFSATAGTTYRLSCQPQSLSHCELRLYDLAENLLASQTAGPGAQVQWTAPSTAAFAFRITGGGGAMGTYLVKVEDLGP